MSSCASVHVLAMELLHTGAQHAQVSAQYVTLLAGIPSKVTENILQVIEEAMNNDDETTATQL